MLIAYMPAVNFLEEKSIRGTLTNRLYHHCMDIVLQSLIKPGLYGVRMIDSKGDIRQCWPRVAAHLADYPEQCLVNVGRKSRAFPCAWGWRERAGEGASIEQLS